MQKDVTKYGIQRSKLGSLAVVRLTRDWWKKFSIQHRSSSETWHEQPNKENTFEQPIHCINVANEVSKKINNCKQAKNNPI
ncbi:hypothetical protein T10_4233 [Trichinella papuae]|uniref:Uncharacterized protein n=1 Tax=Trichinella papuae TaxID=268474 RepID=A0A0V1N1F9_9BILA|nr:hypothetical protein T10_4233 [Trichinella papuae]